MPLGLRAFFPPSRWRARVRFARADIVPIAALGIGQFGILIALLNYGLQTVPAGRGALIFASFPLLTLVVAALLGHEHVTTRKISGILATLLRRCSRARRQDAERRSSGWSELGGELAILASAATGAICSRALPAVLARYPTLPVSAFAMAAAAAALLVPAALGDLFIAPAQLSTARMGRDRVHRALVGRLLCGVAVGAEEHRGDARHRVSLALADHRRRCSASRCSASR